MEKEIEIAILSVGAMQTNCYVVNRTGKKECVVIDPGYEAAKIASYIKSHGLENQGVLLTHGHFDHITAVSGLVSEVGGKVYALQEEKELLSDPLMNCSAMVGQEVALVPECLLRDGQTVSIAEMDFKVLHTPGHTVGSCCYYLEEEKTLFSGDTVFLESVGRSDFPTGNGRQLVDSIHQKVFVLPDDVVIYPGHGPETDVAYEKQNNPFA